MYQSEMKEGFIKDYMRSRVVARTSLYSLFRKTEPYERKYDKGCALIITHNNCYGGHGRVLDKSKKI